MRGLSRSVSERVAGVREALSKFLYGMTGYEFARHALEMRHEMEAVFMVVTMGDLIGVPVLPPVYSLRLLPYLVPEVATWKRNMARRKDFWEKEEYDLHAV
ncbi:MAG: hypothetical protein DME04_00270 [Candidatus Rokuibacteriota bacterium]|nr:MAG: hypothetical protein DME04_00270 [Candidatus Rokubacteria bacterium]